MMRHPQTAGMTQNERVLWYLKNIGPLNPLSAWTELGVYRLAARIKDLRNAGEPVDDTGRVDVSNQYGETCNVGEYRLLGAGGQKKLSL